MHIRREVLSVTESPLVLIGTLAERTPGSLKLCYGEPDMPTPEFICRAADAAARAGHTFYTHTAGHPELRAAIASKVHELHGVSYDPAEIMATVGASMGIFTAIRVLVGAGDNAVIVEPTYSIFNNSVLMAGAEPRGVPLGLSDRRFHLDLDRVRAAIDRNTRLLVVNSPSNPTGWVISPDEQRALNALAEKHDLTILADEVYERIVFDSTLAPSFARVALDKDRLVVVNSFSKTYNMTGWRLGWVQSSERVIKQMYKAAEFITSNPTSMVQQAGIVALRDGETHVRDQRATYARRRALVLRALEAIPGVSLSAPQGAFFAFPRVDGVTDSTRFALELLDRTGVAITPGSAFGASGEGHVRFCFAASEDVLSTAIERFASFLS